MSLAFLSPWLLSAAALIAIPWYLHHIRRPEREPVRFSSLMFVPDVKKEVIERRRLQHLLLLLLRMLIIVLLAFAFARPYLPPVAGAQVDPGASRHVILLDASYSMGAGQAFEDAKEAARAILADLTADDRAAVVVFDDAPRVTSPLGSVADARTALDDAELSYGSTDYEAALRRAAELLAGDAEELDESRRVVHLITDFQRRGMPERAGGWRLPSSIEFHPVEVGEIVGNRSVSELALRELGPDRLQVRAKVKNWSPENSGPLSVRRVVNGEVAETQSVEVAPGNATQVSFDIPVNATTGVAGWLEIDDPALETDNRRYFAWNPRRKLRIRVVEGASETTRWPAARLLEYALPSGPNAPWQVRSATRLEEEHLAGCDVLILAAPADEPERLAGLVLPFIEEGGRAVLWLGADPTAEETDRALLEAVGIEPQGRRVAAEAGLSSYLLSWIDFDHPVFRPFAEARYNNFSDVRFYEHRVLAVRSSDETADGARVLARFDSDGEDPGPPAVVDATRGEGRVLVWAFPLDLTSTTLPKSPRFVPLLHESVNLLTGPRESHRDWTVGEHPSPLERDRTPWQAPEPGETAQARELEPLDRPGFLEWRADTDDAPVPVEAVNVAAEEGDPARISPAELALRLCSAPVADSDRPATAGLSEGAGGMREYGRLFLALILAALVLESWYAARVAAESGR